MKKGRVEEMQTCKRHGWLRAGSGEIENIDKFGEEER
jgi:hypothetical protein